MRKTIWNKRIPTLLGLLLLATGIFVTAGALKSGLIFRSQAAPGATPQNIQITNVTDSSFTVSFLTNDKVLGTVAYGLDAKGLSNIGLDDRDQQTGVPKPYQTHFITLKNLKPGQNYYFSIVSNTKTFLDNNAPFHITLPPVIKDSPSREPPVVGKVLFPPQDQSKEAIIYLSSPGTADISTQTGNDGSFILPVNTLRTNDLLHYASLSATTKLTLQIQNPTGSSRATILLAKANPVPPITIPQNYDFTLSSSPLTTTSATDSGSTVSLPSLPATKQSQTKIQILTPKNEESFSDQRPVFKGTALPNQDVQVEIHSQNAFKTSIQANSLGVWTYRPPQNLAPGKHTITITTRDASGIIKQITQSFVVYAAGSQFIEPSVSPTQTTPTPTQGPTPPSSTPLPTPTAIPSPSPSSVVTTPVPTLIPTVVKPTAIPTAVPSIPATGSISVLAASISSLALFGLGLFLFLLTRGTI